MPYYGGYGYYGMYWDPTMILVLIGAVLSFWASSHAEWNVSQVCARSQYDWDDE